MKINIYGLILVSILDWIKTIQKNEGKKVKMIFKIENTTRTLRNLRYFENKIEYKLSAFNGINNFTNYNLEAFLHD